MTTVPMKWRNPDHDRLGPKIYPFPRIILYRKASLKELGLHSTSSISSGSLEEKSWSQGGHPSKALLISEILKLLLNPDIFLPLD